MGDWEMPDLHRLGTWAADLRKGTEHLGYNLAGLSSLLDKTVVQDNLAVLDKPVVLDLCYQAARLPDKLGVGTFGRLCRWAVFGRWLVHWAVTGIQIDCTEDMAEMGYPEWRTGSLETPLPIGGR